MPPLAKGIARLSMPFRLCVAACMATGLLAGASWLGSPIRSGAASDPLRVVDERHARVYLVSQQGREVRVLGVRNGISEIARLPTAAPVTALQLEAGGRHLLAITSAGTERFDTMPLRPAKKVTSQWTTGAGGS